MEHPWAGRADIHTCQTKNAGHDTTWHSRYRYLISSGGPCLPCPDRNWKEPPVTHFPSVNQQSINESDELRVSTTVTSSTTTTRATLDKIHFCLQDHNSCHMRRDLEPCDPIFESITLFSTSLSHVSPQSAG